MHVTSMLTESLCRQKVIMLVTSLLKERKIKAMLEMTSWQRKEKEKGKMGKPISLLMEKGNGEERIRR